MVVAPWWRWTDPETVPPGQPVTPDPAQGRLSVPVIQKYDSPNLVNDFIADPQRCLKFIDDDLVHTVRDLPDPVLTPSGKLLRIGSSFDPATGAAKRAQEYVVDDARIRKIFLATHKRFYLVVCEIHCDAPGFPRVTRDKICQAGFVVRRRTTTKPSGDPSALKPLLAKLASTRMKIARVNQLTEIEASALASATGADSVKSAKLDSLLRTRASLVAVLEDDKARFDAWTRQLGIGWQLQGWFPSPDADKVGSWLQVDEAPADPGSESSFPLYPLIANPADSSHAGNGATIYFGVLPTSSHDCDSSGTPRFDDNEFYEVRCWVKRHLVPHDADEPCRCPDGYFWSRPTAPYKLASHFDLTGTANQPVTVQLPKLSELAAQAGKPSFGVGFAKPPGSLMFAVDANAGKATSPSLSSGFEICFIPIPLITIIATFVLELFLPIVVFLFQLWWMLALKFCIPPQISVGAGIKAELGAQGGFGIGVDVEGSISVDFATEVSLEAELDADLKASYGAQVAQQLEATYAPCAQANLDIECNAADASMPGVQPPKLEVEAAYEPEVTRA
jgi:hypothetical protein